MFKKYDTTQSSWVDVTKVRRYDKTQSSWVDAQSAKRYDTTQSSWIETMKKYMVLSVTSNFYNNSGNIAACSGDWFHCEVKPTNSNIEVIASAMGEFTNPVISCTYSFGYSDECPSIASGFRSHGCAMMYVRGLKNGSLITQNTIAQGNQYTYQVVFDQPKTLTLNGTFDEVQFVFQFVTMGSYQAYGTANVTIEDIKIDGKSYEGNQSFDTFS